MTSEENAARIAGQIAAVVQRTSPHQQAPAIVDVLRPHTSDRELDWIFALAEATRSHGFRVGVLRECTAELAWLARSSGQRMPGATDLQRCDEAVNPDLALLTLAYVHGQRLKADFRFTTLVEACREWLPRFPDDGLIRALAAFGALGARSDGGQTLLTRALGAPDRDLHSRLVCLQGLWFATHLPDQPQQMISLSDELIGRGEDPHSLYYWRASALRRLDRLDEATASVDRAIDLLPIGMIEWHQDYVRERELIETARFVGEYVHRESDEVTSRLRAELRTYVDEIRTEIERQSREARQIVSSSLLNLVEVLGIFVAVAGFLIASGTVVFRSSGFWEGFAAVGLLLLGSVAFFLLLRLIIRFPGCRG